ncbi:MAG: hypothetical protein H6739_05305 [Alphaproteobacteria bacterium]|nr:hypothetical protein [Alphaproteobacteria bacterium]
MLELRFSRSLYAEDAVARAVAAFGQLATIELDRQPSDLVVRLTDLHPAFGPRVADELANYALQATAMAKGVA